MMAYYKRNIDRQLELWHWKNIPRHTVSEHLLRMSQTTLIMVVCSKLFPFTH